MILGPCMCFLVCAFCPLQAKLFPILLFPNYFILALTVILDVIPTQTGWFYGVIFNIFLLLWFLQLRDYSIHFYLVNVAVVLSAVKESCMINFL